MDNFSRNKTEPTDVYGHYYWNHRPEMKSIRGLDINTYLGITPEKTAGRKVSICNYLYNNWCRHLRLHVGNTYSSLHSGESSGIIVLSFIYP